MVLKAPSESQLLVPVPEPPGDDGMQHFFICVESKRGPIEVGKSYGKNNNHALI